MKSLLSSHRCSQVRLTLRYRAFLGCGGLIVRLRCRANLSDPVGRIVFMIVQSAADTLGFDSTNVGALRVGAPWGCGLNRPADWARRMLAPGVSVIVDTETTDFVGAVVEIAVVDSATGETLLDTLVHPGEVDVMPEARAVHGITDADLIGAPDWPAVLPALLDVTRGRIVLAYNAAFDFGRVVADSVRYDEDAQHLSNPLRWGCVMAARTAASGSSRHRALAAGHRAAGDCRAARSVLLDLAGSGSVR